MIRGLLAVLGLTLLIGACGSGTATKNTCDARTTDMLAMSFEEFDQGPDGWRSFQNNLICESESSRVLETYRARHKDRLTRAQTGMLFWHEAQTHASRGEIELAIRLFEKSGWEGEPRWQALYRDATLAFLRSDRKELARVRDELADEASVEGLPPNLDVVDGLLTCFDRPYQVAYGCRADHPRPPT